MFRRSADVVDTETLARFVVVRRWIHAKDQTIKQAAFRPPSNLELSVTRHRDISERKLWKIGRAVAAQRQLKLFGRADVIAVKIREQELDVDPDPICGNKNHARVIDWPSEKSDKMTIAQEIARAATFVAIEP